MTTSFSYTEPLAIETDIFSRLRVPKYENISTNVAAAMVATAIVYNGISSPKKAQVLIHLFDLYQ
jgi:hypothetical protein